MMFLLFLACDGGGGDTEETKDPGGPCTDGGECVSEEFCLITDPADGAEGTCTPIPDGCTDVCDCEEAAGDCTSGQACVSFGSATTLQCM